MCLIVFAFNHHPEFPFILAGNRDEFYAREAQKAHFWDTQPEILAGKDLRAGGTWLGISKRGEFGAITNYRDFKHPKEGPRSRGEIIPDILTQNGSVKKNLHQLIQKSHDYSGFNLLSGTRHELYYTNNITGDLETVEPGIHGLSNAFLDTPWPKVENAKSELKAALKHDSLDKELIFEFLRNSETYPQESLPDTGLSPEMEKAVSPIFIETDGYGTRCSTLLTIDTSGRVNFIEKTYTQNDNSDFVTEYTFDTVS